MLITAKNNILAAAAALAVSVVCISAAIGPVTQIA